MIRVSANGYGQDIAATLTIDGPAGNWDVVDDADPPRLRGTVGPGGDKLELIGPFDAVHCAYLSYNGTIE